MRVRLCFRVRILVLSLVPPRTLKGKEGLEGFDERMQMDEDNEKCARWKEFGMGVIFVTHDIGVAVEISERVAVMYAGQIFEEGTTREIIREVPVEVIKETNEHYNALMAGKTDAGKLSLK